jgi:hypothetical protein
VVSVRTSEHRGLLFFSTRNKTLFQQGVLGRPVCEVCSDGPNIEGFFLYKEHNFDNRDTEFKGSVCSATRTEHRFTCT